MLTLHAAVGTDRDNQFADVRLVQQLLNRYRPSGRPLLPVDGMADHNTISAIEEFQARIVRLQHPDGIVSPDGATFKALCGGRTDLLQIAWGAKVSAEFKQKVITMCDLLL